MILSDKRKKSPESRTNGHGRTCCSNKRLCRWIHSWLMKSSERSEKRRLPSSHDERRRARCHDSGREIPAAMIFLRTPGGISHDPAESVTVEDVEKAIDCGLHLLDQLRVPDPCNFSRRGCAVHNLGQTRSSHRSNHLLLTADTFVRTTLPGMKGCSAIVHIGPALGARFTEYTAEFEAGGELGSTSAQRFVFVIEGA